MSVVEVIGSHQYKNYLSSPKRIESVMGRVLSTFSWRGAGGLPGDRLRRNLKQKK